ncbi:hydantoinase B/oxoprolinase family protein [Granulicella sp. WH15]|uniref:hydantoinase B/oxoprolinase family protein n=1 Tax=Granulicella sp. WH15 TaxID=2602070 RepID=UPI0013669961|nr:hydantoinase B/oxoprolinase family protein [Granulicella sp. WH15]QHN02527.1 hydantoinase B/oxoprolinase family protein [Granulicella sp. WH15]
MSAIDPIELAVFKSATHSIAEEMGATLRRTSFSPNIKERRDYSCAVFDASGEVIAMGDHMPVHLGSMPMSVRAAIDALTLGPGDIALLNDPYAGGTHLPDLTMVLPVFTKGESAPVFYVASRAHHADVGGMYPGSMGLCREVYQEGLRIPPVKLVRAGEIDPGILGIILHNVRTPREREGDLLSQIGACRVGELRLRELLEKYGAAQARLFSTALLNYAERLMRAEIAKVPQGRFEAEDFLDNDGFGSEPVRIAVAITVAGEGVTIDFAGSHAQIASSLNAVYAITYSAVFYVLRCLLPDDAPAAAGLMRPVTMLAPLGSIVNAQLPAPVAGGNVETSQRIVDVLLRALAAALPTRIPAASSGTMNNLTIGGVDPRTGRAFAYYETTAGGQGARPGADGLSGTHAHMTNSLNTPVEALEYAYPFRVRTYGYRVGSGGAGQFRGGDGIIREIELTTPARVTLLADRRVFQPYGLAGGESGAAGRSLHRSGEELLELPGKTSLEIKAGDSIRIESPGGGGWGAA